MLEFIDAVWFTLAGDWEKWRKHTAPFLRDSKQILRVRSLISTIFSDAVATSALDVQNHLSFVGISFLAVDIEAALGLPVLSDDELSFFRLAAEPFAALYRPTVYGEMTSRAITGFPVDASGVLTISDIIERMASTPGRIDPLDLCAVLHLFLGWHGETTTAVESMLGHQIKLSVCPQLHVVLGNLRRSSFNIDALVKLTATLVDFCRASTDISTLQAAAESVARFLYPNPTSYAPLRWNETFEFFTDSSIHWAVGFPNAWTVRQKSEAASMIAACFIAKYGRLKTTKDGHHRFSVKAEVGRSAIIIARGIGRAIGLVIRYEGVFAGLKLALPLVRALHPRLRPRYLISSSLDPQLTASGLDRHRIFAQLTESADHVSRGIRDVLGPGGFDKFSEDSWLRLFGF
jgi:hypothetical protein